MFDNIMKLFKKLTKKDTKVTSNSKEAAKERLHLVLMQDRANVSADFLELMKQEIIEVIKKYIDVDESAIDVRLTNKENDDGTNGAPALYANIPILNIKNEARKAEVKQEKNEDSKKKETTKKKVESKQEKEVKTVEEEKKTEDIISEDSSTEGEKEEAVEEKVENQQDTKEELKSEN